MVYPDNVNFGYKTANYLDYLADIRNTGNNKWMLAYAFDWVGQLDFLLKFNNQNMEKQKYKIEIFRSMCFSYIEYK